MKKYIALLLALVMMMSFVACAPADDSDGDKFDPAAKSEGVMTYEQYAAAELKSEVVVECYVQAHQSWWDNQITVYAQDPDGAYFLYNMACSEEDAAKLVKGTKIKVTGYKDAWSGELEIVDATFEIMEGTWTAEAMDVTDLLGTDTLINHQNKLVSFKGLTVEAIEYKNGEPGDDIYVTVSLNGTSYSFCVERYLTGPDTEVYQTVGTLNVGDKVDITGFLYWYEGPNPHITSVTVSKLITAIKKGDTKVSPFLHKVGAIHESPAESRQMQLLSGFIVGRWLSSAA